MSLRLKGRALHYVLKIGDRTEIESFYKRVLGMKPLRHEEFSEGCDAACNGPYANRWSKTMIGYGPESDHFVIELVYNYGVKSYELGNDFLGMTIKSSGLVDKAKELSLPVKELDGMFVLQAPGGYHFNIIDQATETDQDPVQKVTLASSNLQRTIEYWNGLLGLDILEQQPKSVSFAFDKDQCHLEFKDIGEPVNHAKANGRIAFSVPKVSLQEIQDKIQEANHKILTPLISLDTPGKATVTVVILADPDGHEICFVDDEGFRELSEVDPKADKDLEFYVRKDPSK